MVSTLMVVDSDAPNAVLLVSSLTDPIYTVSDCKKLFSGPLSFETKSPSVRPDVRESWSATDPGWIILGLLDSVGELSDPSF